MKDRVAVNFVLAIVILFFSNILRQPALFAQSMTDATASFERGEYDRALSLALTAIDSPSIVTEKWYRLALECHLVRGEYPEAAKLAGDALDTYETSILLRRLAATAERFSGNEARAIALLEEIDLRYELNEWQYRSDEDRAMLADYYLQRGRDPKEVLSTFLKPLPVTSRAARLTTGNLALAKGDFALAADQFRAAVDLEPKLAAGLYGLARAFESSDPEKSLGYLKQCLEVNHNYVPALLRLAENEIDAEQYERANELLEKVLTINAREVSALALKAVIAHLATDATEESELREKALSTWASNPEFDYLVGKKLSQKYRFDEGTEYQRRALVYDPNYRPAKLQLAQDQLRRGVELEGWQLADEVYAADPYNILAHNLVTLRDNLAKYSTLRNDDFIVRMDEREARIYGQQVLELLAEAKTTLCREYDFEIARPTYVEIFAKQQDFAVRTFGMPGGRGFLGVCFGNVVTMNSPASQGNQAANWQAVLWHEFCHVVTLQKTSNKIPRWLSEGISVYEERRRDRSWGQSMTPRYREMILGDDLTPISRLSEAFLKPKTNEHLLFAYFESSLAVEFLIEKFGKEMLNRLLIDLGLGTAANKALERYVGPLPKLDEEFTNYVREKARAFGPDEVFAKPELPQPLDAASLMTLAEKSPRNYHVQRQLANYYLANKDWQAAELAVQKLLELTPDVGGSESPFALLAGVRRGSGDEMGEAAALTEWVRRDPDAFSGAVRLSELMAKQARWAESKTAAERALAINPLLPAAQRLLATACEKSGDNKGLITALIALVESESIDPADTHFRLAQAHFQESQVELAKRQVLLALETAPRFREAQKLLLQIDEMRKKDNQ
jgi:tetratricopeptide (TPR) repeat protein